nr:magnesium transporter [Marinicella sp. W31]MDC2877785.1 magnesium transporter [Marinicella sp. W31]
MTDETAGDFALSANLTPLSRITDKSPLTLKPDTSCGEAVKLFSRNGGKHQTMACIRDAEGHFAGVVCLHDCLRHQVKDPVSRFARTDGPVAGSDRSAESVAHEMVEGDIEFMPVIDRKKRLVGAVEGARASRFVVDTLQEDAQVFVGLSGPMNDDYFQHSVWSDFRRRFPWVLGLAIAGLAAGYVVHIYESALDALVILALYMPMVADTGGNVGTQSASLVTRLLTTGSIRWKEAVAVMWREVRVSLLMAAMLFAFAFLKVFLISNVADVPEGMTLEGIGLAIAVALAAQVVSATLIGALLPLGAIAVRQDPAVVSGPALTTIVDLTGLLLYFTITTMMLGIVVVH